eukprot:CAMPEP_0185728804 /NCGR_PEP_ID=MMETSP1171-20130828/4199_1 /TAXON_ID=374046 /ORGANISM="Helicotheca tamensis, Strain CCMP826" /LENGTH=203 /DNA_ID=CAMNT_0028397549 /DNA_START=50 /DNA_END=661 /DNA_ORIENTATION=+
MKYTLFLAALLSSSASAFAPSSNRVWGSSTALQNSRVDSSEAVKAALDATKKYGATSPEARVAWDIVEEMDASDNSVASQGYKSDKNTDEKIAALSALLEAQKANVDKIASLASEIKAVKVAQPAAAKGEDSPALQAALKDAREASEKFGKTSKEAVLAWETVEEIASSGTSAATLGRIDDECLVEAIEGCEAIQELSKVLGN